MNEYQNQNQESEQYDPNASSSTPDENPNENNGQQFTSEYSEKKDGSGMKKVVIALALALLVILAAGGAFAMWKTLAKPSPEELAKTAFENFSQAESYAVEGSMTGVLPKEDINFKIDFSGNGSMKNEKMAQFDGQIDSSITLQKGQALSLGINTRFLDDTLYFRITKMPPMLAFFGITDKQWFHIEDIYNASKTGESAPARQMTLTPSEQKEVRDIFVKNDVFLISEPFEETTIGEYAVRHLAFTVDEENLKIALADLQEFMERKSGEGSNKNGSSQNIEETKKELEKALKAIKNISGELWIDTENHLPRKMSTILEVENGELGSAQITAVINFSDYGKTFEITKPAESVSIEDFFKNVNSPFSGETYGGGTSSPVIQGPATDIVPIGTW